MRNLLLTIILSAGTLLPAAELSDAEWAGLKAASRAKPRLIANDDGCDATSFPASRGEPTLENFYAYMLDILKGTQITTLSYCPYAVGFAVSYPSQVTDRHIGRLNGDFPNITAELEKRYGKDGMALAQDFARANNLEFFGCMRVNDTHDTYYPQWLPNWKREHPEYLFGTEEKRPLRGEWTAYDFARPEVRERFAAICREMMERFELDGLELDFCRNPAFFKSVAWNKPVSPAELDMMTAMMRTIRADAERIGRAKQRPIVIGVRLPDSAEICRLLGVDLELWMREGLFDLFFAGSDRGFYNTAADTAALCAKYDVAYYGVVNDAYHFPGVFDRNTVEAANGLQAVARAAGAKGLYYFNSFYFPHFLKTAAGDAKDLARRDKSYFISHQHENNWGVMPDEYKRFNRLPELSPYRKFFGAVKRRFVLQVGDDFSGIAADEMPTLTLYAALHGDPEKIALSFNGHRLKAQSSRDGVLSFPVDPAIVRSGANTVEVDTTAAAGSRRGSMRLFGENAHPGRFGRPWFHIFAGHRQDKQSTMYPDGAAARLADRLRGDNSMVNALYSLAGINGAPLELEFDLKVFPQTEPEGAVLRVADGRNVEIIDFQPGKIRLKFSGRSVDFNTADRFHRYRVRMSGGKISVDADGRTLFSSVPLKLTAGDQRAVLANHGFSVPVDANTESLLIGSLTGPGVGESAWRNFDLRSDAIVSDLMLQVKYPPQVPSPLKSAAAKIPGWDFTADFSGGAVPEAPGLHSTYHVCEAAPGGAGIILDNENGKSAYEGMTLDRPELVAGSKRFRAAEWTVTPLRASRADAGQSVFQMVFRPATGEKRFANFNVECMMEMVRTPWGDFPVPAGRPLRFRAVADLADKTGVLYLDDAVLAAGPLLERDEPPTICWGDLSGGTGGATVLKSVRIAAFD